MKLSINNKKNETTNAAKQHVNNNVEVHEVDVIGLMGALKTDGHAKLSDHFKDAEVVEPVSETPAAPAPKAGKKPKAVKPKAAPKKASALPMVHLVTYTTKKGKEAPMIVGFKGDDDPRWKRHRDAGHKWTSASYRRDADGTKSYILMFGTRYMDAAKTLRHAYNGDDEKLWEKAEDACQQVYEQAVADGKAAREEKKAERKAAKEAEAKAAATIAKAAQKAAPKAKAEPKAYSEADVAAMLSAIAEGKAIPAPIRKLMKAA